MTAKWLPVVLLVCISPVYSAFNPFGGILSDVSKTLSDAASNTASDVTNIVIAVDTPVEKTIVAVGLNNCDLVKSLVGVEYKNNTEMDLSELTLEFITPDETITYSLDNITDVIQSDNFNKSNGLIVYFHGFTAKPGGASVVEVTDAYNLKGGYNVLALDGSKYIGFLYLRSTTMVRYIGEVMGASLKSLVDAGLDQETVHLVGHSLGAHIAGFMAKTYFTLTGIKVPRITGLDPAGPCFVDIDDELKLNKGDAVFVDVVHTDAGVFGIDQSVGHIDFWPNRGSEQPDCLQVTCSHSRVYLYYAESILNGTGFPAVRCDSWNDFKKGNCSTEDIYMGFGVTKGTEGNYYLQTSGESPYALGEEGTKYSDNRGFVATAISDLTQG